MKTRIENVIHDVVRNLGSINFPTIIHDELHTCTISPLERIESVDVISHDLFNVDDARCIGLGGLSFLNGDGDVGWTDGSHDAPGGGLSGGATHGVVDHDIGTVGTGNTKSSGILLGHCGEIISVV